MKNILERLLTDPKSRDSVQLETIAMSEEAFEPWGS